MECTASSNPSPHVARKNHLCAPLSRAEMRLLWRRGWTAPIAPSRGSLRAASTGVLRPLLRRWSVGCPRSACPSAHQLRRPKGELLRHIASAFLVLLQLLQLQACFLHSAPPLPIVYSHQPEKGIRLQGRIEPRRGSPSSPPPRQSCRHRGSLLHAGRGPWLSEKPPPTCIALERSVLRRHGSRHCAQAAVSPR